MPVVVERDDLLRALDVLDDHSAAIGERLSLVQTADGLPIAHEVHPGNVAEASTLLPTVFAVAGRGAQRPSSVSIRASSSNAARWRARCCSSKRSRSSNATRRRVPTLRAGNFSSSMSFTT